MEHTRPTQSCAEAAQAYWGFPIDNALYHRVKGRIQTIREEAISDIQGFNRTVANDLMDINDAGLAAYYDYPVKMVPLNHFTKRIADSGIAVVRKALHFVVQHVFKSIPQQDLTTLANYMDSMLICDDQRAYIAFDLRPDLYHRALYLIDRVRTDSHTSEYLDEVVDALNELVLEGVHYYYSEPVSMIKLGKFTRKAADKGINTASKNVKHLIRKLIHELDYNDLLELADYVESLILEFEKDRR